jgi:diguanylate cyclase (GGDEF)-like protein
LLSSYPVEPLVAGNASDVLFQSGRTRVFRVGAAGQPGSMVCKERLGPDALARVRHETRIIQRLAGIDGVPRLAARGTSGIVVALEDTGGVALAEVARGHRLEVRPMVELALKLARILARVHGRGVVHKDISPTNILLSEADQTPHLIDFELATTFAEDRPGFVHHGEIAGTLSYLAPELTGRTGRSVDYRADLYALGAVLYELATGRPPFTDSDPLQLIHDHLVRLPTPPAAFGVSVALSEIIVRLLEKDPDRRYQSADGLAHDLSHLKERLAHGEDGTFQLGERDFALRLSPPSRLIGREAEIEALRTALENAVHGNGRSVLVAGAPGVGKTALINELRPMATARRGWMVSGKFDQYRPDAPSAVVQAMRALGRLLLAEPEAELIAHRQCILGALGGNAGLITAILPEFALLLGAQPEVTSNSPLEAGARLRLAATEVLRAIVSPERPVVMVLEDLQWSAAGSVRFFDDVTTDNTLDGLLLVGTCRESEVGASHPLSAVLPRWRRMGGAFTYLRLGNLPPADLCDLLAEMLRLPPAQALSLAEAVGSRTGGNPYDTVELVNSLRRDGALTPSERGWVWDAATIRRYVGQGDVVDLLSSRIANLPDDARALLDIMACLGGEMNLAELEAATGASAARLEQQLVPPLEDGLLVLDAAGAGAVQFRHDRVQQAAYGSLSPQRRRRLHLAVARRLARRPELGAMAAEQYLAAIELVRDPSECRDVVGLFRGAATQASRRANYVTAERFLAAAIALTAATAIDEAVLAQLEVERHAALCSLGRHDDADQVYRSIEARTADALALAEPAGLQVSSLTDRGQAREAVALGLSVLARLGLVAPTENREAEIDRRLDAFYRWVQEDMPHRGAARPASSDPRVAAMATLINRMTSPAFFCSPTVLAWLVVESQRLWAEHGPSARLAVPLSCTAFVTVARRGDYRTGYDAVRYALAESEARGYEPETSQARFMFTYSAIHWFEVLERSIEQAQHSREGLLHGGDLQTACFSYFPSLVAMLDCAPTLEICAAEIEAGLAFAARTGNDHSTTVYLPYRQLVRALRGETAAPGSLTDASFDEEARLASLGANRAADASFHVVRALVSGLFGDMDALSQRAVAAMPKVPHNFYPAALAHLLQAIALAERIKAASAGQRAALLAELDACASWLARRAGDAPGNFAHLHRLVEAERAWAIGEFWAAACFFEAALHAVEPRQRRWHQALITERAGLFHLSAGLQHVGRKLMEEARQLYAAWGATAKAHALDRAHALSGRAAITGSGSGSERSVKVSADTLDILAILRASQALSSETSLERLQERVIELVGAMTGATQVTIAMWADDPEGWYLSASATGAGAGPIRVEQAAERGLLPLTAFRYVERSREPLLVEDAARDDRFSHDPYLAGLGCCSLLVIPILSQGILKAVLLLENRLSRGAFSAARLDAVMLIAGQLAVSLDNASLYASLERKVAERTTALAAANASLEEANRRLELLSNTDPLTGLANRRRFDDVLEAEWKRALASASPIAVALVDVDHFKSFNDRYGHAAGDACLRQVSAMLGHCVRHGIDLAARYGGEEFVLVLPGADLKAATAIARRVLAAVAALRHPHQGTPRGVVTVSIGVASRHPSAQHTSAELINAADAALYQAKQGGRNRVHRSPAAQGI